MGVSTIQYLTTIKFGAGASHGLSDELRALSIQRPLIVTDAGLIAAGIVEHVLADHLKGLPVFSDTPTNPTESAASAAATLYRERDCDGLVAIGGGSPIDLAKAVALLVTHDGGLADYAAITGGVDRIGAHVAPVVAVPTTSGTGAEVGRAALVTVNDGRKLGIISPHLIPKRALCDPELTLGLPPTLTAATGMDAITHCFETYLSPRKNEVADAIALDGLTRGWQAIETATENGKDTKARTEMMMASLQGGLTFQKGLGAVHSLSHPLGAVKSVNAHHGTLNAILLPHVLSFNTSAVPDKIDRLCAAIRCDDRHSIGDFIAGLVARLGLPTTLSEIGFCEDTLAPIPALAMQDHSTPTNSRPLSEADFEDLLRASL